MTGNPVIIGGRYTIQREIGRGGMAVVFEATCPLGRVALKVMNPPRKPDEVTPAEWQEIWEQYKNKFLDEAKVLRKLDKISGIVRVWDYGEYDGRPFLAMEYIEGVPLDTLQDERLLSDEEVIKIVTSTAKALDAIHNHKDKDGEVLGVVHRDVKPSNIMIGSDFEPTLIDFGIAQNILPRPMAGVGLTAAYASPEQIDGKPVNGKSDQYSLAVVAFEMLSGYRPFNVGHRPLQIKEVHPRVRINGDVDRVFTNSLHEDNEKRYPSCTAFAYDLISEIRKPPPEMEIRKELDGARQELVTLRQELVKLKFMKALTVVLAIGGIAVVGLVARLAYRPQVVNPIPDRATLEIADRPLALCNPNPVQVDVLSLWALHHEGPNVRLFSKQALPNEITIEPTGRLTKQWPGRFGGAAFYYGITFERAGDPQHKPTYVSGILSEACVNLLLK